MTQQSTEFVYEYIGIQTDTFPTLESLSNQFAFLKPFVSKISRQGSMKPFLDQFFEFNNYCRFFSLPVSPADCLICFNFNQLQQFQHNYLQQSYYCADNIAFIQNLQSWFTNNFTNYGMINSQIEKYEFIKSLPQDIYYLYFLFSVLCRTHKFSQIDQLLAGKLDIQQISKDQRLLINQQNDYSDFVTKDNKLVNQDFMIEKQRQRIDELEQLLDEKILQGKEDKQLVHQEVEKQQKLLQEYEEQNKNYEQIIDEKRQEVVNLRQQLDQVNELNGRVSSFEQNQNKGIKQLQQQISDYEHDISILTSENEKMLNQLINVKQITEQNLQLLQKHKTYDGKIMDLEMQVQKLDNVISQKNNEIGINKQQKQQLVDEINQLQQMQKNQKIQFSDILDLNKQKYENLNNQISDYLKQIGELKADKQILNAKLEKANPQRQIQEFKEQQEETVQQYKNEIQDLKNRLVNYDRIKEKFNEVQQSVVEYQQKQHQKFSLLKQELLNQQNDTKIEQKNYQNQLQDNQLLKDQISNTQKQHIELQKQFSELYQQHQSFKQKQFQGNALLQQNEKLEAENKRLRDQVNALQDQVIQSNQKQNKFQNRTAAELQELNQYRDMASQQTKLLKLQHQTNIDLQVQLQSVQFQYSAQSAENVQLQQAIQKYTALLQQAKYQVGKQQNAEISPIITYLPQVSPPMQSKQSNSPSPDRAKPQLHLDLPPRTPQVLKDYANAPGSSAGPSRFQIPAVAPQQDDEYKVEIDLGLPAPVDVPKTARGMLPGVVPNISSSLIQGTPQQVRFDDVVSSDDYSAGVVHLGSPRRISLGSD